MHRMKDWREARNDRRGEGNEGGNEGMKYWKEGRNGKLGQVARKKKAGNQEGNIR